MTGHGAQYSRHDSALPTQPIPTATRVATAVDAGRGGVRTALPVYRGNRGPRHAAPSAGFGPVPGGRPGAGNHGPVHPRTAAAPPVAGRPARAEPASPGALLMKQLGGPAGMAASVLPSSTFVVAQSVFSASLPVCLAVAVGVALAFVAWRYARGEALRPALSGVFGVLASALVVVLTGEAANFYLLGILASGLGAVAFLVSILVGKPLVGVTWHALTRRVPCWWTVPGVRRAFDLASWTWVVVFGARVLVQGVLYSSVHAESWLGWARLAMGLPLTAVAAGVTVWAVRRAGRSRPADAPTADAGRG
jgi:hypothetical protein